MTNISGEILRQILRETLRQRDSDNASIQALIYSPQMTKRTPNLQSPRRVLLLVKISFLRYLKKDKAKL